jgi:hypothetical protein
LLLIHPRREVATSQLSPPPAPPPGVRLDGLRPARLRRRHRCRLPSSNSPAPPPGPPPPVRLDSGDPLCPAPPPTAPPPSAPATLLRLRLGRRLLPWPASTGLRQGLRPASASSAASSLLSPVAAAATNATRGATVGKGGRSRVEP